MNPCAVFIRRPVASLLLALTVLFFGVLAYRSLPVSDLPNVEYPTITITASLPGANPEMMAASVATPLERQLSSIPGIDSMHSTSIQDSTSITVQFALDRNIDGAAQDVEAAISRAAPQLPPNMPSPPSYQKSERRRLPRGLSLGRLADAANARSQLLCGKYYLAEALQRAWRRPSACNRSTAIRG